jgi:hypothetical protein
MHAVVRVPHDADACVIQMRPNEELCNVFKVYGSLNSLQPNILDAFTIRESMYEVKFRVENNPKITNGVYTVQPLTRY